jgi:hypothetical protein
VDAINQPRARVWTDQPSIFFTETVFDFDGTLVHTDVERKQRIDIAYDGVWGYHPLPIWPANTAEPLSIFGCKLGAALEARAECGYNSTEGRKRA